MTRSTCSPCHTPAHPPRSRIGSCLQFSPPRHVSIPQSRYGFAFAACASVADGCGISASSMRPVSAAMTNQKRWQPVSVKSSMVNIIGGYNTRGEAAPSIQCRVGDTTHTFIELNKSATWFLKGVGGLKIQKGDLKAVAVIALARKNCL